MLRNVKHEGFFSDDNRFHFILIERSPILLCLGQCGTASKHMSTCRDIDNDLNLVQGNSIRDND